MDLNEAMTIISELRNENKELRKMYEELEKRLRKYENPHTPSSKQFIKKSPEPKEPGKKGAPKGHIGTTRMTPTPDEIIELQPESCPFCKSNQIQITNRHKKTVEDIEIKKKVTEFHYYNCHCSSCQKDFTTSSNDLPKQGRFGPNICSLWSMLHYKGTIPLDRLSNISGNSLKIPITAGGLQNIIYRTVKIFEPDFVEIKSNVKKSKYARSDETSYPYNGKKYWLWNISTDNETLVLIRNSRGSKILKEVFGDFFDGILNSDCFSAYSKFKAREYQKCWAHIIRDAKDLAKNSKEGEELYKMISNMYKNISKIKEKGRENALPTKFWIWFWKARIDLWLHRNYESKAVRNLVLRMAKYKEQWFTCLKYPFVEATNNASERDIRKNVIARKISGLHRSKLGLHSREIMMSVLLTLQRRNENCFDFVLNGIGEFNSGCG